CTAERIILAGYSAGALITGDALQSPALTAAARGQVAAAVLLADPEFNPTDRHTAAGTFDPRYAGTPRRPSLSRRWPAASAATAAATTSYASAATWPPTRTSMAATYLSKPARPSPSSSERQICAGPNPDRGARTRGDPP